MRDRGAPWAHASVLASKGFSSLSMCDGSFLIVGKSFFDAKTATIRRKVFSRQSLGGILLIHFIHYRWGYLPRPGGYPPGSLPFCRKVFSMVSALWRSIAHTLFIPAAIAAGLRTETREASFLKFPSSGGIAPEPKNIRGSAPLLRFFGFSRAKKPLYK